MNGNEGVRKNNSETSLPRIKLSLDEYTKLPPDDLEAAARELGTTSEKLLALTQKAIRQKAEYQEKAESVELPTKTNLQKILEKINLSFEGEITEAERDEAAKKEAEAYRLVDTLSNTDLTYEQRLSVQNQIAKNFIPSLRLQFIEDYHSFQREVDKKDAFRGAMQALKRRRDVQQENLPQIWNAYSKLIDEINVRDWFTNVSEQYIADPRTLSSKDSQLLNKLRQSAYRGFNGDRVTSEMKEHIPGGYMQKIPGLIYEEAKALGVGDVHYASEPSGPSEVFGGLTPNAFSRQNRPRRQNDELEHF